MLIKHLILFIASIAAMTISLIDLLSSKVVRANEDLSQVAISTMIYLIIGLVGLVLFITAIALHRKSRKDRKAIEDFY